MQHWFSLLRWRAIVTLVVAMLLAVGQTAAVTAHGAPQAHCASEATSNAAQDAELAAVDRIDQGEERPSGAASPDACDAVCHGALAADRIAVGLGAPDGQAVEAAHACWRVAERKDRIERPPAAVAVS